MKTPPLALYAHFPWCVQKCPYCDFNSYTLRDELPEQRYIETLKRDLDAQVVGLEGRRFTSIFLGGGTPSLFSPAAIGSFIDYARGRMGFEPGIEVTVEANPGTIERGRFAEYRAAGVTRVSLGAQSFDERQLKTLGRIHSADETRRAAEELHAAGLSNFNLDLMYALPGQTADDAIADLRAALTLSPAHLSQYHLTIEPGTLFAAAPPTQPADDVVEDMLARSLDTLRDGGFEQYEVQAIRGPMRAARTTSTTGISATTLASARARTARSPMLVPAWSCAPSICANPGAIWRRNLAPSRAGWWERPNFRSNSP
jgi:oxygen-independent coproporphyrinogen-3 oxidase